MEKFDNMILKEYSFITLGDIQRQIFLGDCNEGIYTIQDLLYDRKGKERYLRQKQKLDRGVYLRVDEQYLKGKDIKWIMELLDKCQEIGMDFLILPLDYYFVDDSFKAYSILAQKLNSMLISHLNINTHIILENINQSIGELAYLIHNLNSRLRICLNIDACKYQNISDMIRDLKKFDLLKHIQIIKITKGKLESNFTHDKSFNEFISIVKNSKIELDKAAKYESELRLIVQ
jgi:hypothetical protein